MSDAHDSVDGVAFDRDEVVIDGDEIRLYERMSDGTQWPSVSTVVSQRDTPEKDEGIQGWRDFLNSRPDRPDPDDVLSYKGWRGTLAHWKALKSLASYDLAGDEEVEAYEGLKGWEYRYEDALSRADDEVEWFTERFREMAEQEGIARFDDDGDVIEHRVKKVEQYVFDPEVGYAGQYDLLYEHADKGTVLADLKTSKSDSKAQLFERKFPDYGLQLAAYARAANYDVDHVQLLWASPDTEEYAVVDEDEMPRSRASYETKFVALTRELRETLDGYDI